MQTQEKKWLLGLIGVFFGICLLLGAVLYAYLATDDVGQGDLTEWMKDASKDLRGTIPPLPEAHPYEPSHFVPGELSPFARDMPVAKDENHK